MVSKRTQKAKKAQSDKPNPDDLVNVFYSSAKKLYLPGAVLGIISIFMVLQGVQGLQLYPATSGDPFRYFAGYLPLLIGVGSLLLIIASFAYYSQFKIGITPEEIISVHRYTHQSTVINWQEARAAMPLLNSNKLSDKITVTDGSQFITAERLFFPKFEKIRQLVDKHRQEADKRSKDISI